LGARSRKVGGGRRPDSLPTPVLVLLAPGGWARLAAAIIFVGFNLTFFPQYILGYLGVANPGLARQTCAHEFAIYRNGVSPLT